MRVVIIFLFLFISINANCQVTTDFLNNTFFITNNSNGGTAFSLNYRGNTYLISARHIFPSIKSGSIVNAGITVGNINKVYNYNIYFDDDSTVDVAVLVPINVIIPKSEIELDTISSVISQQLYFLGFPYSQYSTFGIKHDFKKYLPIPFVKGAILSGINATPKGVILYLDGHNNPGFSGGPLIGRNAMNTNDRKNYLFGVVVAYVNQQDQTKDSNGNNINYTENSGLFYAFGCNFIKNIIDKNFN